MKHNIYIVDDNRFVREALALLFEDEPDLKVCGMAETATEALAAIPGAGPDLVLTDLSLPGMSGIELVQRLLIQNPRQRVAILSAHPESHYAEQARVAGARGYILKGNAQTMMEGIRHILSDGG